MLVEVAQKGLGHAGSVPIPVDLWDRVTHLEAVEAMGRIKVPCKELTEAESAMVLALEHQGHLVQLHPGMSGYGKPPSAPIFIIPKTAEKCSLMFNCQLGNKKFEGPNPPMKLPNLYTLKRKFLSWRVQPQSGACAQFLVKLDLTNCYPSLLLPSKVWGTFRSQGLVGVDDLRLLPFGWRFSPAVCQEVVVEILDRLLRMLPLPAGYSSWEEVDFDHHLDDLLFVEEDREWLECCGPLLARYLTTEGFVVSQKSVLSPVVSSDWLRKRSDLGQLRISNS